MSQINVRREKLGNVCISVNENTPKCYAQASTFEMLRNDYRLMCSHGVCTLSYWMPQEPSFAKNFFGFVASVITLGGVACNELPEFTWVDVAELPDAGGDTPSMAAGAEVNSEVLKTDADTSAGALDVSDIKNNDVADLAGAECLPANGASGGAKISADGRYVLFKSEAGNLVPGDNNGKSDVFIRDRQWGTTEWVSVAGDGKSGNEESRSAVMSPDGRYIAFASLADNLVAGDANGKGDVFVRDRKTGKTELVSLSTDGKQGDDDSGLPSISADGRYVAFSSKSSNLTTGYSKITPWHGETFVRDRLTGKTERVSIANNGKQGNETSGGYTSISADGRFVAFESIADNFAPGDYPKTSDIFVRDRQEAQIELISINTSGKAGNESMYSAISADGRFVVFQSFTDKLVAGDNNDKWDIVIRDRQTGKSELVSVSTNGSQGNGHSAHPSISPDGRYVAFSSDSDNFVKGDVNGWSDVFIKDRKTGTLERVSLSADGKQGNDYSFGASVSADGRFVAFWSSASTFVTGDSNTDGDVFLRDLLLGTTEMISVGHQPGGPSQCLALKPAKKP